MAFYEIDLTSRPGAEWATHLGSIGCFGFAVLSVIGLVLGGGMAGFRTEEGMAIMVLSGLQAALAGIAGMRFRQGKGAFSGIAVAVLLGLNLAGNAMSLSILGIIFNAVLLICVIQGIRGAFALRQSIFPEDEASTFD